MRLDQAHIRITSGPTNLEPVGYSIGNAIELKQEIASGGQQHNEVKNAVCDVMLDRYTTHPVMSARQKLFLIDGYSISRKSFPKRGRETSQK
jgi:hypothetical protein